MSVGRVAGIETELGIGAYCPVQSMVRVPYDGIIGDVPLGNAPVRKIVRSMWHPEATRLLHSSRGRDGRTQQRDRQETKTKGRE